MQKEITEKRVHLSAQGRGQTFAPSALAQEFRECFRQLKENVFGILFCCSLSPL